MKILRILQEREFERVGGTKTVPIDVRVIAATNKNLVEQVKKGEFREDLYYRLNVMFIEIPPLRERMDDLEALVDRLLARISDRLGKHVVDLSSTAMDFLRGHSWPGNVAPRNYVPFPVPGQNGWPLAGIPRLGSYEAIEYRRIRQGYLPGFYVLSDGRKNRAGRNPSLICGACRLKRICVRTFCPNSWDRLRFGKFSVENIPTL